ncbi:MAG TPA: hypothetical protein VL025_03830 [Thermoanaerobaculia bacterium]|nr:hypothetical protein [Thermoanaerobaculia bacterium]
MRVSSMFRVVFILYCFEAGTMLLFLPWHAVWDQLLLRLSSETLRQLFVHPVFRGAVSGFGLVHLVWGAHDLEALLLRPRTPAPSSSADSTDERSGTDV